MNSPALPPDAARGFPRVSYFWASISNFSAPESQRITAQLAALATARQALDSTDNAVSPIDDAWGHGVASRNKPRRGFGDPSACFACRNGEVARRRYAARRIVAASRTALALLQANERHLDQLQPCDRIKRNCRCASRMIAARSNRPASSSKGGGSCVGGSAVHAILCESEIEPFAHQRVQRQVVI